MKELYNLFVDLLSALPIHRFSTYSNPRFHVTPLLPLPLHLPYFPTQVLPRLASFCKASFHEAGTQPGKSSIVHFVLRSMQVGVALCDAVSRLPCSWISTGPRNPYAAKTRRYQIVSGAGAERASREKEIQSIRCGSRWAFQILGFAGLRFVFEAPKAPRISLIVEGGEISL